MPTLETPRLILRATRVEDFGRYVELFSDPDATRYIGGPAATRGLAWRRFLQMPGAWALQGYGLFAVEEKASGRWIGQCGPWQPADWTGSEVGYALHPDAQGRGYATEACIVAIDYAFDVLGWTEVIHNIDADNLASQAVARRLGASVLRRVDHAPPFDEHVVDVWGQTRDHWRARRAAAETRA
ncbi:MAG: GNAT family N-acetyltransferase [Pseudoxanthomonas suwonensis]|nr:GNAT family N-acetyltransferase [Pseudoxanthomonas suwonensis]